MSIRILLVDDHNLVRQGFRALLEKQADIEVIAEAGSGREALQMAEEMVPDIVVMDIAMPDLNGIEATRRIISNNPKMRVLALSMYQNRRFIVEMLKAGACGYLVKDSAVEELTCAIRILAAGKTYLSPAIADTVVREYVHQARQLDSSAFSILTDREREVLQLLAEGKTRKETAELMCLSTRTIETHRKHVMDKLNIRNTAELIKYAIREGLTSPDM